MKRRDFVAAPGCAQQRTAPVVGYLSTITSVPALLDPADAARPRRRGHRMRRRSIVLAGLAGLILAPVASRAQQASGKMPRIGVLSPADSEQAATLGAFREGLRDLGYVEGRNIALEFRLGHGNSALLPQLAAELVQLPLDAILVDGGPGAVRSVMQLTQRIPIVGATGGDPVVTGVVSNLSRPGGN